MAGKLSPMMQQYFQLKEQHPQCLLFFRLGDFYEMFFEDAETASRELDLTLTGRDCGMEKRAPMCGVPFHAVDGYVAKLLQKGYKVAICEQLVDPALAKGLVDRGIVRIITPGTVTEGDLLDEKSNHYLACLSLVASTLGLAYCDVSTGEFTMCQLDLSGGPEIMLDELVRIAPSEVLSNAGFADFYEANEKLQKLMPARPQIVDEQSFEFEGALELIRGQFTSEWVSESGCAIFRQAVCAAGVLLTYLRQTQMNALPHINHCQVQRKLDAMVLDPNTRRNLELTESLRTHGRKGSLLWLLDSSQTALGSRQLRHWMEQPLQEQSAICARLDAVEELMGDMGLLEDLRGELKAVKDIERIVTKLSYETLNARDCQSLDRSIEIAPRVIGLLQNVSSPLLQDISREMDPLPDVHKLLSEAIEDNPPLGIKDGGIIRAGYHEELDTIRDAATGGKDLIAQMEAREREETGIKNLRIGFNKVFGYFIEVTRSNLDAVPYRYIRKQTLANCERFVTEELGRLEETILGAQERSTKLEYDLFCGIRSELAKSIERIQKTARAFAQLDALQSLSTAALEHHYVKPDINNEGRLEIVEGRHPVVECSGAERFVPNNTTLDLDQNRFAIITGPNMAGKSTFLRQVALITLMAHMGSFVPAASASICLTDRIFTRIGASDDLFMGQSTFMVEMSEVATILQHATQRSLIILDEIGRGTSTFDGLAIAWAVVEYLCQRDRIGAKTLFATHYHELIELEGQVSGVKNYSISVKETGHDVVFLRRIVRGGTDKSFGIHVGKLAGLPREVLDRANEILTRLEEADLHRATLQKSAREAGDKINRPEDLKNYQMDLGAMLPYHEVLEEIRRLDMTVTTPIDAFYLLNRLKEKMK